MMDKLISVDNTLLVADDDELVRDFLKTFLEKAGYRVIVAADGEEALIKFKEYDDIVLILTDFVMPKKNGRELLEDIRRIKPKMNVIIASGYVPDSEYFENIVNEWTEFIDKPFNSNSLLGKIRKLIG